MKKKTGRKRTRTSLDVLIRSRPVPDFTRQCKRGVPSRSLMNKYLISYAIIANGYRLSILFALLPYVVEEEVLLGTRACDRRKNFMDMRGCYGRRNCTRGRQKCNAFTPENRIIGIPTLPLQNRLRKPLYLADFQGVKASHLWPAFLSIRGT